MSAILSVLIAAWAIAEERCDPVWSHQFSNGFLNSGVGGLAVFDEDGDGPEPSKIFLGGAFTEAGHARVSGIVRFDGATWSDVGGGITGGDPTRVRELLVVDEDGDGPERSVLYAVGDFTMAGGAPANKVAKWDGEHWSGVGTGHESLGLISPIIAIATFDDDGGGPNRPKLYVGGSYPAFHSTPPGSVLAYWDGANWSPAGLGLSGYVEALHVYDADGGGPGQAVLLAGGAIKLPGETEEIFVAAWDGNEWSAFPHIGGGQYHEVSSLCTYDEDGVGPIPVRLYAGGSFTINEGAVADRIAVWDGVTWSPLSQPIGQTHDHIADMLVFDDDGDGPTLPALYVAGRIHYRPGGTDGHVARWDGTQWATLEEGLHDGVAELAQFDPDGDGPQPPSLIVGGGFRDEDIVLKHYVARWAESTWHSIRGPGEGIGGLVYGLAAYDEDAHGPFPARLFAYGSFQWAGNTKTNGLARWDGFSWSSVGEPGRPFVGTITATAVYDNDGLGPGPPELFVGGDLRLVEGAPLDNVARWDGKAWQMNVSATRAQNVRAFCVVNTQPDAELPAGLYASGRFSRNLENSGSIARWSGSDWLTVAPESSLTVRALKMHDSDGVGTQPPLLYAAGSFTRIGGVDARRIARWDGMSWMPLDNGLNGDAYAIAGFDEDGDGPFDEMLFVGGSFTMAGASLVTNVARWNGTEWQAVGAGVPFIVRVLFVFDDDAAGPHAPELFAGGTSRSSFGAPRLMKWNGTTWSEVATTIEGSIIYTLASFDDDGTGRLPAALYVGGAFEAINGISAKSVGRLGFERVLPDFTGDAVVSLSDFVSFLSCMETRRTVFQELGTCCTVDANRDARIDLADFAEFQSLFAP